MHYILFKFRGACVRFGGLNVVYIHIERDFITAPMTKSRDLNHLLFEFTDNRFVISSLARNCTLLLYLNWPRKVLSDLLISTVYMLFEFTERGFIRAGYCTSRRPSVSIRSRDFGLNWLDFYVIQLLEDEIERLLSGSNGLVSLIKTKCYWFFLALWS